MRGVSTYSMATFRAEMHRRRFGEQKGPRLMAPRKVSSRALRASRRFFANLVRHAREQIAELDARDPREVMPCPWAAAIGGECWGQCPCGNKGTVTVGFMRTWHRQTLAEYGAHCLLIAERREVG